MRFKDELADLNDYEFPSRSGSQMFDEAVVPVGSLLSV